MLRGLRGKTDLLSVGLCSAVGKPGLDLDKEFGDNEDQDKELLTDDFCHRSWTM